MRVNLTRASVAMGDDVDAPHRGVAQVDGSTTLGEFVREVAVSGYFPQMACWVVYIGPPHGTETDPVAMLTAPWDRPRFLDDAARNRPLDSFAGDDGDDGQDGQDGDLSLYFDYRTRVAPETLWLRLLGAEPTA
ncbi:hypothetical protein [Kitasatospora sp. NPDC091207]|uniref:hypothetical protein n=1 Tax=Kitasatospora sp. NPDC091207 TaxID=3364083 RepID=UPI00381BF196